MIKMPASKKRSDQDHYALHTLPNNQIMLRLHNICALAYAQCGTHVTTINSHSRHSRAASHRHSPDSTLRQQLPSTAPTHEAHPFSPLQYHTSTDNSWARNFMSVWYMHVRQCTAWKGSIELGYWPGRTCFFCFLPEAEHNTNGQYHTSVSTHSKDFVACPSVHVQQDTTTAWTNDPRIFRSSIACI